MSLLQPTFYIPHGGGPCFFMDDPGGVWTGMETFLRSIPDRLAERPKAILILSGHWETDGFSFTGSPRPPLLFDYYNFPKHTYELRYDARETQHWLRGLRLSFERRECRLGSTQPGAWIMACSFR